VTGWWRRLRAVLSSTPDWDPQEQHMAPIPPPPAAQFERSSKPAVKVVQGEGSIEFRRPDSFTIVWRPPPHDRILRCERVRDRLVVVSESAVWSLRIDDHNEWVVEMEAVEDGSVAV